MGSFDNIPQDLLIRAVKKHAKEQWMVLYIERWLKAPVQEEDGQLPLIGGWRSGIRSCRLSVSPMMPSCIAGRKWRLRRFGQQ